MGCSHSHHTKPTTDDVAEKSGQLVAIKRTRPLLYYNPVSQPCRAITWMLKNHDLMDKIEWKHIDIARGEHLSTAFTETNPQQTVPVLELEDGTVIAESAVILLYFQRTFQLHSEMPSGSHADDMRVVQALMHHDQLAREITRMLAPAFGRFGQAEDTDPSTRTHFSDEAIKEQIAKNMEQHKWRLGHLDRQLGETKFIAAPEWTLADYLAAAEISQWADMQSILPEELQIKNYPNAVAYIEMVSQRPGYAEFVAPWNAAATELKLIEA